MLIVVTVLFRDGLLFVDDRALAKGDSVEVADAECGS